MAAGVACASALAACNAIFGVEQGDLASTSSTGAGGAGGAGDASSSSSGGTGGEGGSGGHGGAATTTTGGGMGGAGGSVGPLCDGAESVAGSSFVHAERNGGTGSEVGGPILMKPGGTLFLAGTFRDADTKFGGHTLEYPTPGGGLDEYDDIYLVRMSPLAASVEWARAFGGPLDQEVKALAMDASRNLLAVGVYQHSVAFGDTTLTADTSRTTTTYDAFVAKLDENGNPQWARRIGGPENDFAQAVATTWDGVYVAGVTYSGTMAGGTVVDFGDAESEAWPLGAGDSGKSGVFLTKLDGDGNVVWHHIYDVDTGFTAPFDPGDAVSLATGPDGYVYVAGGARGSGNTFGGPTMNDYGDRDVFVAKIDPDSGSPMWAASYGDGNAQVATAIAVDACNEIVIAGHFRTSIAFGGATSAPPDSAYQHIFVAKLGAAGAPGGPPPSAAWLKSYWDYGDQDIASMAVDTMGDIAVAGSLIDGPSATGIDLGKGPLVGTIVDGTPSDRPDGFVAKLDGSGATLWAARYAGSHDELASGVALDDSGCAAVTGMLDGTNDFGGGDLVSNGEDMFLAVYGP